MELGISATQAQVDRFNEQFGLDRPFLVRMVDYITGIFTRFDFGISYRGREPVMSVIIHKLPITITVAVYSVIGALLIGVPMGVLAAIRHARPVEAGVNVLALFLSAIPIFWFGMMLVYVFSIMIPLFPTFGAETWKSYVLPVLSLAVPGSAGFMRLTRVTMLDVVHQEYIKTARAKGAPEHSVIWKHAFRNAALPLINGAGLMFGALLGGTVIIESVFSLPGLGRHIVTAILQRDLPIVMGCTIFLSAVFMVIILAIDIAYAILDPRIRRRFAGEDKQ
jgi:peptide/nickel transport system permease protein